MRKRKPKLSVIPSFDAGESIVDKLEQVMERAKAGELSMVAIATVERDGSTGRTWSQCHNTATLLGSIELMKVDIIDKHNDA